LAKYPIKPVNSGGMAKKYKRKYPSRSWDMFLGGILTEMGSSISSLPPAQSKNFTGW
jgi:hypothetical protein